MCKQQYHDYLFFSAVSKISHVKTGDPSLVAKLWMNQVSKRIMLQRQINNKLTYTKYITICIISYINIVQMIFDEIDCKTIIIVFII